MKNPHLITAISVCLLLLFGCSNNGQYGANTTINGSNLTNVTPNPVPIQNTTPITPPNPNNSARGNDTFQNTAITSSNTSILTFLPVQCRGNIWDIWTSYAPELKNYTNESDLVKAYYNLTANVTILNYWSITRDQITCMSCDCARGDILYIEVNNADAAQMESFGWHSTNELSVPITIVYNETGSFNESILTIDNNGNVVETDGPRPGIGMPKYPTRIRRIGIDLRELLDIASTLQKDGFFDIEKLDDCSTIDLGKCPTGLVQTTVDVKIGTQGKVLSWYWIPGGMPKSLAYLQGKINEIRQTLVNQSTPG